MQAAVLTHPRTLTIEDTPPPEPGPTQVLVRIEGSGVCGSNLPPWEGRPWFAYPFEPGAPGHEGWGRVAAVGHAVSGLAPGERVTGLSYHAFAEFDIAEAAHLVPLPPGLAEAQPVPGEAVACAVNVSRRAGLREGDTVAVLGIGFLGALLVQLARHAGARVVAASRRPYAREVARACGAAETVDLDAPDAVPKALAANDGRPFDCVIEATGTARPLDLAGELTRERGRLVIAGYHQDGRRSVDLQLWNWRGLDVINAHERDPAVYVEGLKHGLALLALERLDLAPLVTHTFPLREIGRAFEVAAGRPDRFLKSVVVTHA